MFNSRALLFAAAIAAVVLCLFNFVADAAAIAVMNANVSAPLSRAEQSAFEKRSKRKESSAKKYSGKATWFIPSREGGSMSACRKYEADDDYVVAMNAVQYGRMNKVSDVCGKRVRIYHGGKSVDAVINDACPSCKYGDLDLTKPVFGKLGKFKTGILDITWRYI
ncbi:uncharacterized protein ATC70_008613 [Mucor velutinosus]|uniref:RlpA-like protein double-psi beta-barrel domain-containing protein n=1 Tax=Mucor velutinosus TaxID=708070 RepID=A0AAN7DNM3_9FUNG|nr:hypothetical protein ATC70_008613 [Mucor velutinosus]